MSVQDMQHEDEDDRQAGKWKDGDFLTPKEVAEVLSRTSVDSIRRHIRSGRLPASKTLGGQYLVPWWAVKAELEKMTRLSRPQRPSELPSPSVSSVSGVEGVELPGQGALL